MRKQKHFTTDTTRKNGSKKVKVPGLATGVSTEASRAAQNFIPPLTREQLMAGSANLRRVYKVEA